VIFGAMWRRLEGDEAARVRSVHAALEQGITTFDTAPLYDFGQSERLLSRALVGYRQRAQVLTKVGLRWDENHGRVLFRAVIDGRPRDVRIDGRPHSVRKEVEDSLLRLGVEHLELVQVHQHDTSVPVADTVGELARLREEGKLSRIGVSNHPPAAIRQAASALGEVPLCTVQDHYSLLHRRVEDEVLPTAREVGAGMLCYSPLEQGLLAGALLDRERSLWPDRGWLFSPENVMRINSAVRSSLLPIARERGVSTAAVALAWLLAQPGVTGVVVGASDATQVCENAQALELSLNPAECETLTHCFSTLKLDEGPLWRRAARGLKRRASTLLRRLRS
jgi:aryl-alcohol dehydrogenase-like predicted oxidoreductase